MNAILFDNYGPYQWARVRAASEAMATPVLAVELYGHSAEYAWDRHHGGEGLEFVTLLPAVDSTQATTAAIESRMNEVFAKYPIKTVAVPGWGYKGSLAAMRWGLRHGVPVILMSETTAWDEARVRWKEWIKRRIVGLASAALVGGRPHADYLAQLGMPRERVFFGYDAVDNGYFAAEAAKHRCQLSVVGCQEEGGVDETQDNKTQDAREEEGSGCRLSVVGCRDEGDLTRGETPRETAWRETRQPLAACHDPRSSISPYFLASNRFIEKKNLFRLLDAYAQYARSYELSVIGYREDEEDAGDGVRETGCGSSGRGDEETPDNGQRTTDNGQRTTDNGQRTTAPWPLCLLGDGELRERLIAHCAALGLNVIKSAPCESDRNTETPKHRNTVYFPGFRQIEELPRFYAHAGAFVHASTTEQWGLVINEAMACGLPVLVSNRVGCATDLVQDGVNGFTFDPYDVGQLSALMAKISAIGVDSLVEYGEASRDIIADWGPERFASGLKMAVERAQEVGPVNPSFLDRLILNLLIRF